MNLFFRLVRIFLFSRFLPRVSIRGPCDTYFRCWPTDLDIQMHMNNGRYFSILDIARTDLIVRANLEKKIAQQGWFPVVAAETIKFKNSIRPLDLFKVETNVIGWDEKAVFIRQLFLRKEAVVAEAVVKIRFLKKAGGSVASKELLALAGIEDSSPTLEPWILQWNQNS